ncbi:unnamed protein product [marine sediment metagenome]|uniref:Uncharacterized protein n=1 Tax=marine sediment metagenome TaxID=412755 RepID=X1RU95_9ZZZZ
MPEQLALPFIAEIDKEAEKEQVAAKRRNQKAIMASIKERYPMTEQERTELPPGVRLCRFVGDWECEKCPYGYLDHTLSWYFQTKVCLKDFYKAVQGQLRVFRIYNTATREWWEGEAGSAWEACAKAGWDPVSCWVREKTYKGAGGWKSPEDAPVLGKRGDRR